MLCLGERLLLLLLPFPQSYHHHICLPRCAVVSLCRPTSCPVFLSPSGTFPLVSFGYTLLSWPRLNIHSTSHYPFDVHLSTTFPTNCTGLAQLHFVLLSYLDLHSDPNTTGSRTYLTVSLSVLSLNHTRMGTNLPLTYAWHVSYRPQRLSGHTPSNPFDPWSTLLV